MLMGHVRRISWSIFFLLAAIFAGCQEKNWVVARGGANFVGLETETESAVATNADIVALTPAPLVPQLPVLPPLAIQSLVPGSGWINPIPQQVVVSFSRPIQPPSLNALLFSGTCSTLPTISRVFSTSSTQDTWTFDLSNAVCQQGQTLTWSVAPALFLDAAGIRGTGVAKSVTYTLQTVGPVPNWGLLPASLVLSAKGSLILPFTYSDASKVRNSDVASGVVFTGTPVCVPSLAFSSPTQGLLTLSHCSGDGSLVVQLAEGLTEDSAGNASSSSQGIALTIDNTPPTIVGMTPASAALINPLPSTFSVMLSEAISRPTVNPFSVSGCQGAAGTLSVPILSEDKKMLTVSLSGGACTNGQTLVMAVDPTLLMDEAGNQGVQGVQSQSYTLVTMGPSVSLTAPASPYLIGTSTISIPVSYANAGTLIRRATPPNPAIQTGGDKDVSCMVSFNEGILPDGDAISISGCIGDGQFTLFLIGGTVQDEAGNPSVASNTLSFTVETTLPTITSLPAGGNLNPIQMFTVTFGFSKSIQLFQNSPIGYSASSTCSNIKLSPFLNGNNLLSVKIDPTQCADGTTFQLSVDPTQLIDVAGNTGAGSSVSVLYRFYTQGPVVTLSGPAVAQIISANDTTSTSTATLTYTVTSGDGGTPSLTNNPSLIPSLQLTDSVHCTSVPMGSTPNQKTGWLFLTCTGSGVATVQIPAGIWQDDVIPANSSTASTPFSISVDNTPLLLTSATFSPHTDPASTIPPSVVLSYNKPLVSPILSSMLYVGGCSNIILSSPQGGSCIGVGNGTLCTFLLSGSCSSGNSFSISSKNDWTFLAKDAPGHIISYLNPVTYTYTPPTASLSIPAVSSTVGSSYIPSMASLTFSIPVSGGSVSLGITGTCSTLPTVAPSLQIPSSTSTLSIPLTGGVCGSGQKFTLTATFPSTSPVVDTNHYAVVQSSVSATYTQPQVVTLYATSLIWNRNPTIASKAFLQLKQCANSPNFPTTCANKANIFPFLGINDPPAGDENGFPLNVTSPNSYKGLSGMNDISLLNNQRSYSNYYFTCGTGGFTVPPSDAVIVGPNGIMIGKNFLSMRDWGVGNSSPSIGTLLSTAGILSSNHPTLVTGFKSGGLLSATGNSTCSTNLDPYCDNWASGSTGSTVGITKNTDTDWGQATIACNQPVSMLCLCW